jgi:hypothetical protein
MMSESELRDHPRDNEVHHNALQPQATGASWRPSFPSLLPRVRRATSNVIYKGQPLKAEGDSAINVKWSYIPSEDMRFDDDVRLPNLIDEMDCTISRVRSYFIYPY